MAVLRGGCPGATFATRRGRAAAEGRSTGCDGTMLPRTAHRQRSRQRLASPSNALRVHAHVFLLFQRDLIKHQAFTSHRTQPSSPLLQSRVMSRSSSRHVALLMCSCCMASALIGGCSVLATRGRAFSSGSCHAHGTLQSVGTASVLLHIVHPSLRRRRTTQRHILTKQVTSCASPRTALSLSFACLCALQQADAGDVLHSVHAHKIACAQCASFGCTMCMHINLHVHNGHRSVCRRRRTWGTSSRNRSGGCRHHTPCTS